MKGWLLLEQSLSFGLFLCLTLCIGISFIFSSTLLKTTYPSFMLLTLREAQLFSHATGQDTLITVEDSSFISKINHDNYFNSNIPSSVSIVCNRSYGLGFKPNLNSKYAGSFFISTNQWNLKFSLPVGLSTPKLSI